MLEPTRDEKRDGTGDHDTQEVLTETHEQHEEVATVLQLPYSTQQQDQHDHNNVAGSAIPRLIPHVQVAQPASEITALTTQQIEADGRVVFVAQAATGNGGETAAAAQVVASSQGAEDVAVVARNVSTVAGNQPLLPAITQMSVAQGQAQQFYLMVPAGGHDPAAQVITQNVTTRAIAPRAQQAGGKQSVPRSIRDERRRSTHNEVERRRRDKINTWITELAKVVPDCQEDLSKQGQSKGGVLAKTVEYIQELQQTHSRMTEMMHNHEQLTVETQVLQARISDLEHENATLKAKLQSMESQMLQNRVDELEMENAALKAQFQECSASTTEESAMNTS